MLLDQNGLNLKALDPNLASVLGSSATEPGAKLLVEAGAHGRQRVALRDWVYVLLKSPARNPFRTEFGDNLGLNIGHFINDIEAGHADDGSERGLPPAELLPDSVTPEVLRMLEQAEALSRQYETPNVSDAEISFALIECSGNALRDILEPTLGEERYARFRQATLDKVRERIIHEKEEWFGPDGRLLQGPFSADGWSFLKLLREDMAAIGLTTKLTTRHVLYSMLGKSSGPLAVALAASGLSAKDLHATLARELSRSGRKRNDSVKLTSETLMKTVIQVLDEARHLAKGRSATARVTERDLHRAFLAKDARELQRLLPRSDALDSDTLAEFLASADDQEEEVHPLQRYTLEEMKDRINGTIFGQQLAVEKILPWIARFRFGLPRDSRPAGVFLFLGPTGTGKTQLGKELARYVYGNEEEMLFLEMGQFKTKESLNMFIGAPPGYVGYGEGKLTNGLRDHPECVVLFDEIEKADVTVFDTLLRFADEGRISDPAGPVRDGRKCIIVMTTNAGQRWLRDHIKQHPEARENPAALAAQLFDAATHELAAAGYRPEFLGRIDERITFLPFSLPICRKIVDGVLRNELASIEDLKGVKIIVPDEIRDELAQLAYARAMDEGARGAPRAINNHIIGPVIEVLSPYLERGQKLPASLKAKLLTAPGAGELKIRWEAGP